MPDEKISLSEMIQTLRSELETAQKNAKDSPLNLKVDSVELELSVAITNSNSGKGGIKFWVIEAGGETKQEEASTHKFKLTLKPYTDTGDLFVNNISSRPPSKD